MEALRHATERELYHRVTQPPYAGRRTNPVTVFSARLADDTGLQIESKKCRTDTLLEKLSKTQPGAGGDCTAEEDAAKDCELSSTHVELISLPKIGEDGDRIGLDRDSLIEVYKYLDLDPWLLGQLCRGPSGWTCCSFATDILNFQLMTSMYYIAWSVNTARGSTKTKAILIARQHIVYSRWFSTESLIMQLLETSIIKPEDPLSLANVVLLDIISYVERELDAQWKAEIWIENLTGHGVFAYRHHEKMSSLDTQHLAFAAKEMGICTGIVSYCIRLTDIAERMVSDLEDEAEKFHTTAQEGRWTSLRPDFWTGYSSMIQSLNSNKKRIWNSKVDAKDLDSRVKAQSNTVSLLFFLFSVADATTWTDLSLNRSSL